MIAEPHRQVLRPGDHAPDAQDARDGRPGRGPDRERASTRWLQAQRRPRRRAWSSATTQIDALEEEIDQLAIRMLATRQPMAVDLRLIAMAMKISNDLERIGDYAAKGIAKRCQRLAREPRAIKPLLRDPAHGADRPGRCSRRCSMPTSSAMPTRRSRSGTATTRSTLMYDGLFRELLTYMMEDPRNISACIDLHRSSPRTSSGWAITRPTSPRRSTTSMHGERINRMPLPAVG